MNGSYHSLLRKELLAYAKECISRKCESSDQGNHGRNWFRKMYRPDKYIVGNDTHIFVIIKTNNKLYMNKIL